MIQTIENIAEAACSSLETARMTYAIVQQARLERIPGDVVECGVFGGAQAAIMAKAIMSPEHYWEENKRNAKGQGRQWPERHVHLFDSFQGIPEPGLKDPEMRGAGHKAGLSACSLEAVKANMKQWGIPEELVFYHPGWFADTIPSAAKTIAAVGGSIAVLRLDGDLYDSTLICLEHLYPLLSPGGFLIVDDYALSGARQAVEDYFDHVGGRGPIYMRKP